MTFRLDRAVGTWTCLWELWSRVRGFLGLWRGGSGLWGRMVGLPGLEGGLGLLLTHTPPPPHIQGPSASLSGLRCSSPC